MKTHGQRRRPLPDALQPAEREFFAELRRVVDVAGLTCRALQETTSLDRTPGTEPCFFSKSQWDRWLNGQAMPPRKAVGRLIAVLAAEGVDASDLMDRWDGTVGAVVPVPGGPPPDTAAALRGFLEALGVKPAAVPAEADAQAALYRTLLGDASLL